jgi:hypothetical protein
MYGEIVMTPEKNIEQSQIDKINEILDNPSPKYDNLGGYEVLVVGIAKNLPDTYGENTAKNFSYQLGTTPGRSIANKIIADHNNQMYENPIEAFIQLAGRLKNYYKIKILDISQNEDGETFLTMEFNSYLDNIYEKHPDIPPGGILFQIDRGYFEGALYSLTGRRVKLSLKALEAQCSVVQIKII